MFQTDKIKKGQSIYGTLTNGVGQLSAFTVHVCLSDLLKGRGWHRYLNNTNIPTELNAKGMHGNGSVKSGTGMKCASFGPVSRHDQSSQTPAANRATCKRTFLFQWWSYFKTNHQAGTTSPNRVSVPICQSNQLATCLPYQQLLNMQNKP